MTDFSAAGNIELTEEEKAGFAAMANATIQHVKATPQAIPKEVQLIETQRGEALAELAINEARTQMDAWRRIYRDILKLTAEGRAGFRSITAKHAKEMRAHVKVNNDAPEYKRARNSALTRLSECNTITKALDNGAKFDPDWPFPYAVGYARTHLEGEGLGDKRGRPADSWMDKLKKFVAKNVPADELLVAAQMIDTMAAVHSNNAQ